MQKITNKSLMAVRERERESSNLINKMNKIDINKTRLDLI